MGGIIRSCKKWLFVGVSSLLLLAYFPAPSKGVATLELLRDTIATALPGAQNVYHDVSFILPLTSQQVVASDWLIISLPGFKNVTLPSFVTGNFGTPSAILAGTTIKITDLAIRPGAEIHVVGFTATNPSDTNAFLVTVSVANDINGATIRNSANTQASQGGTVVAVSTTVESSLSSVIISGFSSPGAFATLTENGTVIGTQSSDGSGQFRFSIGGLDPGDHSFRINATDINGLSTSQAALQLYLLPATLTSASNIILSPTISLDKTELQPGDTLTISGSALPNSAVSIFTESPLRSYSTTTNASGIYSVTLPSNETRQYVPGVYRTYANVQDNFGNQSIVSLTLNFTVTSPSDLNNPPPACNISHGDLNCDGKTNLTDFSILLFHWRTNHKVADINNDGSVNLVDFSIMMFYFKR